VFWSANHIATLNRGAETTTMTRNRRAGLTLIEVLVSMFIMSFGLLAIMTLFPLGAINMAKAVRDDRSYQAARSADGLFRAYWKGEIAEPATPTDPVLFNTLSDPNYGLPPGPDIQGGFTAARANEWSYPVVVDPWAVVARPNGANPVASQWWVGDTRTMVPRRSMAMFPNTPTGRRQVFAALSLKDTKGYDEDLHLTVDTEYRYNFMWIIQQPLVQNKFAANMTVVVFDDRPFLFAPAGTEPVIPNPVIPNGVYFTPNTTTIVVPGSPELKPGMWVMDASVNPAGNTPPRPLIRHANPYQVVSVTPDPATPGQTLVDLATAVKTPTDNNNAAYTGTLVILRGASGAYTRMPLQ
jgi:type II secretory pathway pseudopilin PulG